MYKYRYIIFGFCVVLSATSVVSQEPARFDLYEVYHKQFIIWLPEGWIAASDDSKFESDLRTSIGRIVFGPERIEVENAKEKEEIMKKYTTGELPSFSVQRFPLKFDIYCDSFPKETQRKVVKMVYKDPMFDRKNKHLERFRADTVFTGECVGIRIRGRTQQPDGIVWVMDAYAFADDEILYLFTLKNVAEYYEINSSLFEQFISTLVIMNHQVVPVEGKWPIPERVFQIEDGSIIGLQAGVMYVAGDRPTLFDLFDAKKIPALLDMLAAKDKHTAYFVVLNNYTKQEICAIVTLSLTTDMLFGDVEFGKSDYWYIKPGATAFYVFPDTLWEIHDNEFDNEVPLQVDIWSDCSQMKGRLGTYKTTLFFRNNAMEEFLNAEFNPDAGKFPFISAWKETSNFFLKIPGTIADSILQRNILWKIMKREAISDIECESIITNVELTATAKGIRLCETEDGGLQFEEDSSGAGERIVEKWYVNSCGVESVYEVNLLKSPQGEVYLLSLN